MNIIKLIIICLLVQPHDILKAVITSPSTPTTVSTATPATPSTTTVSTATPSTTSTISTSANSSTTSTNMQEQAPVPLSAPTFTTTSTTTAVTTPTTNPTQATPTTTPTTPATSQATPPAVPTAPASTEQFLTSIYIQNNFQKDALLNQIDFLVSNKETPLVKANLNIKIPALKNLYSKGSIIGFDVTSPSKDINSFNGIASITINNDKISFTNVKTGYGIEHPIKITQKNGHWILDEA